MANVRVYELAKKVGVDSKVVLDKMTELGHLVRSASATIEAPVVRELIDALSAVQERMPEQRASEPRSCPGPPPAGSVLRPQHHEWDPTSRWKPLQPFDPRRVGPYTVLRRIGSGSMGRVFLGQSPAGRLLAVKVVKEELADDPEFRRRFQREVAAARGVNGFYAPPSWTRTPAGTSLAGHGVRLGALPEGPRGRVRAAAPEGAALGGRPAGRGAPVGARRGDRAP